jgi:hypothetical protein
MYLSGHRNLRSDHHLKEHKHAVNRLLSNEFRPKTMVAGSKNKKNENFFYSILHKHLQQKSRLQFCRFSHQTCRLLQLWGAAFFALRQKAKIESQNVKHGNSVCHSRAELALNEAERAGIHFSTFICNFDI